MVILPSGEDIEGEEGVQEDRQRKNVANAGNTAFRIMLFMAKKVHHSSFLGPLPSSEEERYSSSIVSTTGLTSS